MSSSSSSHRHRERPRDRLRRALATRARSVRSRSWRWRLLAPVVFVAAGVLFVTSMVSSGGTDLRAGRYDDLAGLAHSESAGLSRQRAEAASLSTQVDQLTRRLGNTVTAAAQEKATRLRGPAGLDPVHGPGVTISLDDAPDDALAAAGEDVSDLLVHQQDIQAVANALWAGGAEAMTIQGQRVVATTGIKCVGNTVVLHGVPYSPPYRISAIGPAASMMRTVDASPYIRLYRQEISKGLGWDVERSRRLRMPGYDGSTELDYARPLHPETGSGTTDTRQ